MGLQHRLNRSAQHEVGIGDDACGDGGGAILPAGALGGDALDELGLAYGLHLLRAVGPIHGAALDEDRLGNVVAPAHVFG